MRTGARPIPLLQADDFPFSCKKLNPAGALFDYAKLCDVSKNVIATHGRRSGVYGLTLEYAREFDPEFAAALASDPSYACRHLCHWPGREKPRKDLATWKDGQAPIWASSMTGILTPGTFPAQRISPRDAVRTALHKASWPTYDPGRTTPLPGSTRSRP
ncbi:MAG: hypothetical protein ACLSHU_03890 [Oscillospiraceae bacterium]